MRVADAIAKLRRLRDGGIETIVDPTVYGLGRYIPRIQRINAEVDLNIVVATGVYAFLELRGFLGYRGDEWLIELFVRELREGIDDTGVKRRVPEVRGRGARARRRHPAHPRGDRGGGRRDRRAGDGAHERARPHRAASRSRR